MARLCPSPAPLFLLLAAMLASARAASASRPDQIVFAVLGDYGVGPDGEYRFAKRPEDENVAIMRQAQLQVADAMERVCAEAACGFVINTGDSFYDAGVASVEDPQWRTTWSDVYNGSLLVNAGTGRPVRWYSVLGNHDYAALPGRSVRPQFAYGAVDPTRRWVLEAPGYYSFTERSADGSVTLGVTALDTEPLFASDYNCLKPSVAGHVFNRTDWQPGESPACKYLSLDLLRASPAKGNRDPSAPPDWPAGAGAAAQRAELSFLRASLAAAAACGAVAPSELESADDHRGAGAGTITSSGRGQSQAAGATWSIGFGHHPPMSLTRDIAPLRPELMAAILAAPRQPQAWWNGHDHVLAHLTPPAITHPGVTTHFFTSGAGAQSNPMDLGPLVVPQAEVNADVPEGPSNARFASANPGFALVTLDAAVMRVSFYDLGGGRGPMAASVHNQLFTDESGAYAMSFNASLFRGFVQPRAPAYTVELRNPHPPCAPKQTRGPSRGVRRAAAAAPQQQAGSAAAALAPPAPWQLLTGAALAMLGVLS